MAFIPTAATAKAGINATINGESTTITLWFEGSAAFSVGDLTDLGLALWDWITASLSPIQSTGVVYTDIDLTAQDSSSAPSIVSVNPGGLTGAVASPSLPQMVAAICTFQTDSRGRSYRGRNYVPGVPTSVETSTGIVTGTYAGSVATAFADLSDVEAATGTTHVVVSHYADHAARAAGVTTPVVSYRGAQALKTQRRRSIGHGA